MTTYIDNKYLRFHGELQNNKYVDQQLREYFPNYDYKGIFFDVGAFEPITISNSHHFYMNGWEVYSFEAIPENVSKLAQHRKHVFNYAISDHDIDNITFSQVHTGGPNGWTASYSAINLSDEYKKIFGWSPANVVKTINVPQRKLDTIIKEYIPNLERIDIMSLDIEGGEYECLRGLDIAKHKPYVIVLENASHTNKYTEYLSQFGYRLDKNSSYNYYFVADDKPSF
jgi:FkbM family methyltransferase